MKADKTYFYPNSEDESIWKEDETYFYPNSEDENRWNILLL